MMSEDTRFEDQIVKSLHKLDEILSKAQIQTGGQSDVKWSGGDTEEYDSDSDTKWDDEVDENGTDYVGKGMENAAERDDEEEDEDDEDEAGPYDMAPPVKKGVEVSEFLNELTKSIVVYCSQLEDTVEKSLQQMHHEQGEMAKAIAHNLDVLSDVLSKSENNIVQYAGEPARGPKSMLDMSKSVGGASQQQPLDKNLVLSALVKGVEAGTVSPLEVIKCEQLGVQAVSHDVVKSLLA
tara:strand:- start:268 stop:978 length:711 start_codon:yes stop_codon:yes gene_type:complete